MGYLSDLLRKGLRQARVVFCAVLVCGATAVQTTYAEPVSVVELFTSQGCSSCPPADRLAEKLATQSDILMLSLSVDYWDYLGWKDTLADPAFSERQRAYANKRGDRAVYTPQMVINGQEHVVGSNAGQVAAALKRTTKLTAGVSLRKSEMGIEAKVSGDLPAGKKMATVFFVSLSAREEVAIGRGENAGATVTYTNVVQKIQPIGMWSGGEDVFRMPKSELMRSNAERCAIIIQIETEAGPGQIIGAAMMDWAPSS